MTKVAVIHKYNDELVSNSVTVIINGEERDVDSNSDESFTSFMLLTVC